MRGKAKHHHKKHDPKRITPAYAGKSRYARRGFRFGGDHPRLCGEKGLNTRKWTIALGSPPPMRGKADRTRNKEGRNRITPAYAGKSGIITVEVSYMQDHPRLCGEKWQMSPSAPSKTGSPPPMRGKAEQQVSGENHGRITPAYAGKSRTGNSWTRRHRDHPRLCGEKMCHCLNVSETEGSPPPMRGKVS